jgi:hypothetical protein
MAMGTQQGGAVARPANALSMNPATFVQGGLIDDVDVEILDARFCYYDYGKGGEQFLMLGVQMKDADGKTHDQYYSAGDKEFFEPSVEGVGGDGMDRKGGWLIPKGNKSAMGVSTNAGLFLASLVKEGFPVDRMEQLSITEALVGSVLHVLRQAQPKRKGLIKTGAGATGDSQRDPDILLCSKVISLPGQAKVALGKSSGAASTVGAQTGQVAASATVQPTAQPVASSGNGINPDLHDEATIALLEILSENNGTIAKKDIAVKAFKKLMTHPKKAALIPYLYSEPFLNNVDGVAFDGATVKMA